MNTGTWIALGVAIGVGIGAAMDNVAIGIAIGAGIGVAIGAASRRKQAGGDPRDSGTPPSERG